MIRKKKHVYVGLILLGGLALIVDRVLLSGTTPVAVDAASITGSLEVARGGTVATSFAIPELCFPRDLPPMEPVAELRDWFQPPAGLLGVAMIDPRTGRPVDEQPAEQAQEVKQADWELFRSAHRLEATVAFAGFKMAVIDGEWIRLGTTYDDCELLMVSGREVVFRCADGLASLALFDDLLKPQEEVAQEEAQPETNLLDAAMLLQTSAVP